MIVSIKGTLIGKSPSKAIIEANGIGYQCNISINTFEKLGNLKSEVSLMTHFHVTENSQLLFGFDNSMEMDLFKLLIGVSGIGPKTAINILSAVSPEEFKRRLIAGEVVMLTALPGIGPKTARRIIVELKDKFVKLSESDLPKEDSNMSPHTADAYDALLALGFQVSDIRNAINSSLQTDKGMGTEDIIKNSLSILR